MKKVPLAFAILLGSMSGFFTSWLLKTPPLLKMEAGNSM